jgi:hypothetical protein
MAKFSLCYLTINRNIPKVSLRNILISAWFHSGSEEHWPAEIKQAASILEHAQLLDFPSPVILP